MIKRRKHDLPADLENALLSLAVSRFEAVADKAADPRRSASERERLMCSACRFLLSAHILGLNFSDDPDDEGQP